MRLCIRQEFHREGVGIWLMRQYANGYQVGRPTIIEFADYSEGFTLPEPTFHLLQDDFQKLVQSASAEMIGGGFAPSAVANASELKATKVHLEDMRTLVFKSRNLR